MIKLIPRKNFTTSINGKHTELFILRNGNGLVAQITNYRATLASLWTPDRNGILNDIVLGYDYINDYLETENIYFGKTIGRFGNRIANARFTINNKTFELDKNEGVNHIHGGENGFHNIVWDKLEVNASSIKLQHLSPEGTSGYPVNVTTTVTYKLIENNTLQIDYTATTDAPTHINLTHHSYFNLEGQGNGNFLGNQLQIIADSYTPTDTNLIPTGSICPVTESLDFRESKKISTHISYHKSINGYDYNFIIIGSSLCTAAILTSPKSDRTLEVLSTEPGIQFFSGQEISSKSKGKNGVSYGDYSGPCLEPQHLPNSPNQSQFPSTLLLPDEKYESTTVLSFKQINYKYRY